MLFIDGIGYVNETQYTKAASTTNNKAAATSFEDILSVETGRTSASGKTYTLDDIFNEAAEKYSLPKELLTAVAYNESRFQTDAVSSAGATGIMQLMPATAKAMGVTDSTDAYQNIMGGAKLLSQLYSKYDGNLKLTLAAYNAGSGNVDKYGGIPPFTETQNYVEKVLNTMSEGGAAVPDTEVTTGSTEAALALNSFYKESGLDNVFSYSDYELFMNYFEDMLSIISGIGASDDEAESESDNSLLDLYRLGTGSSYNRYQSDAYNSITSLLS